MHLGPSTTLVLNSGSWVGDCKCIRSSIWETLAKYGRITHPQVANHFSNFPNFPVSHLDCTTQLASESETSLWISLDSLDEGLPWEDAGPQEVQGKYRKQCYINQIVPSAWSFNLPLTRAVPESPTYFSSVSFLLNVDPHP